MRAAIVTALSAGAALFYAGDDPKTPPPASSGKSAAAATPAAKTEAAPPGAPAGDADKAPPAKKRKGPPPGQAAVRPAQPARQVRPEPRPDARPTNDVSAALEQQTFADFSETPLSQLLQFFSVQHNIHVHVDEAALAQAMVDRDQAVTFQMTGVRLGLVLDLMLEPLNLDYMVRENVLFISSRDRVEKVRETAVVRIGDLLPPGDDAQEAAERIVTLIRTSVNPGEWITPTPPAGAGGLGGGLGGGGEAPLDHVQYVPDARSLVVTANGRTHRKVAKLLADFRSAKVAQGMPTGAGAAPVVAR